MCKFHSHINISVYCLKSFRIKRAFKSFKESSSVSFNVRKSLTFKFLFLSNEFEVGEICDQSKHEKLNRTFAAIYYYYYYKKLVMKTGKIDVVMFG